MAHRPVRMRTLVANGVVSAHDVEDPIRSFGPIRTTFREPDWISSTVPMMYLAISVSCCPLRRGRPFWAPDARAGVAAAELQPRRK